MDQTNAPDQPRALSIFRFLQAEYPELLLDYERVQRGEKPSEFYEETQEIVREAVSLEPALQHSQVLVFLAAQIVKLGATRTPLPMPVVASPLDDLLARDFPELVADAARVDRGEKPISVLYAVTGQIHSEVIGLKPELTLVILSARLAEAKIAATQTVRKPPQPDVEASMEQVAGLLDIRLGTAWRNYRQEMLRLSPFARGDERSIDAVVNFLEIVYWAARCASFSQADPPASELKQ